ncbi:hypothetical protein BaRGS_00031400, partial [Batillaria attramentaria]
SPQQRRECNRWKDGAWCTVTTTGDGDERVGASTSVFSHWQQPGAWDEEARQINPYTVVQRDEPSDDWRLSDDESDEQSNPNNDDIDSVCSLSNGLPVKPGTLLYSQAVSLPPLLMSLVQPSGTQVTRGHADFRCLRVVRARLRESGGRCGGGAVIQRSALGQRTAQCHLKTQLRLSRTPRTPLTPPLPVVNGDSGDTNCNDNVAETPNSGAVSTQAAADGVARPSGNDELTRLYENDVRTLVECYDFALLVETFANVFPSHLFPLHDVFRRAE